MSGLREGQSVVNWSGIQEGKKQNIKNIKQPKKAKTNKNENFLYCHSEPMHIFCISSVLVTNIMSINHTWVYRKGWGCGGVSHSVFRMAAD